MSANAKEKVINNSINCYGEVFPTIKVKNQIKNEKQIGKIFTTAVDLVATSSAMFLEKIVECAACTTEKAPGLEGRNAVIILTKENIQEVVENNPEFDFLCVASMKAKNVPRYGSAGKNLRSNSTKKKRSRRKVLSDNNVVSQSGISKKSRVDMKGIQPGTTIKNCRVGNSELDVKELETADNEHLEDIVQDDEDYD
eukprot:110397_1